MKITAAPIANGTRFMSEDFMVEITDDLRFFTIVDNYGEACGTITRPLVMGGNRHWESHLPNGKVCTTVAVGPRSAFRSFIMAYSK